MGNRCYVVFRENGELSPAVYLHWNGGPESVYAFLDAMGRYNARLDTSYATARFCQIVGNFFGGNLSLGCETYKRLEDLQPGDNGLYVVTFQNGKRVKVERFTGYPERWLTPEEVEAERVAAYAHSYHHGEPNISQKIDSANLAHFARDIAAE